MKPVTLAVLFALVTFTVIAVDAAPAPEATPAETGKDILEELKDAVHQALVKHIMEKLHELLQKILEKKNGQGSTDLMQSTTKLPPTSSSASAGV